MKLTLDALKERADAVASEELLLTISGGTENACHDEEPTDDYDPITGDFGPLGNLFRDGYNLWQLVF